MSDNAIYIKIDEELKYKFKLELLKEGKNINQFLVEKIEKYVKDKEKQSEQPKTVESNAVETNTQESSNEPF
jgi:hypothetical protein